jgi:hypothetical protein
MPGIVYILGAGASHGENLHALDDFPAAARSMARPPLVNGFFLRELWDEIGYDGATVEKDFPDAFGYIRHLKQIEDPPGEGAWRNVDLEEIFTFIELEREYRGQESDHGAKLTIIRNQLVRYISRILGCCTQYAFGEFSRVLANSLRDCDSILSFNYDLLIDQELRRQGNEKGTSHYLRFFRALFGENARPYPDSSTPWLRQGMFIKMHGSLSWIQCTNGQCPESSKIDPSGNTQDCLSRAIGIHGADESCPHCGSDTIPLLIPPLLRKPVGENWILRCAWGLARYRLEAADAVVIVGYSAPPSDFYAKWLLQSGVGVRGNRKVYVVNPSNAAGSGDHVEFARQMGTIFPYGYNAEFHTYAQISEVVRRVQDTLAASRAE